MKTSPFTLIYSFPPAGVQKANGNRPPRLGTHSPPVLYLVHKKSSHTSLFGANAGKSTPA